MKFQEEKIINLFEKINIDKKSILIEVNFDINLKKCFKSNISN